MHISSIHSTNQHIQEKSEERQHHELSEKFASMLWQLAEKSSDKAQKAFMSKLSQKTDNILTDYKSFVLADVFGKHFGTHFDEFLSHMQQHSSPNTPSPLIKLADSRVMQVKPQELENRFRNKEDFLQQISKKIAQHNPCPDVIRTEWLVAQAALESGYGESMIQDSNNIFNIKAHRDWNGPIIHKKVLEYDSHDVNFKREPFRQYATIDEGIKDFFTFIQHPRYEEVWQSNNSPQEYFTKIAKSGFATDPAYAEKCSRVLASLSKNIQGDYPV